MRPLNYGFIGLGRIAQRAHLSALRSLVEAGEVRLQALCDLDEGLLGEVGRLYGVEALYTDHHEMLERERLDALYVLLPPTLHTDAEVIAAERGIALFVEKPQTLDLKQAVWFDEIIRRSGIVSQVGFMTRYYPAAERAKEILAERIPRHASVQLFYSGAPIHTWTSRWELCGGSFVENTIHMVDLLRYLYGDIVQVSAFYLDRKPGEERGAMNLPHVYMVNYRFASGVLANVTTARVLTVAGVERREVTLLSEDSLIEWSRSRIVENGRVVWEQDPPGNAFELQAAAFARAVREKNPEGVRSPYHEALNSLAAVLGANESAARGGEVVHVRERPAVETGGYNSTKSAFADSMHGGKTGCSDGSATHERLSSSL
jgi:myo-inositol 2-dehydrogenase / D-chiro-inositol 1-dehydrogenase